MLNLLKRVVPHDLRQRMKRSLVTVHDMPSRLAQLRHAGFSPAAAIDGGAFHGEWTELLWSVWPSCISTMIEPQPAAQSVLANVATRVSGSRVVPAALGASPGRIGFRLEATNSRIEAIGTGDPGVIEVAVRTIDDIVSELRPAPTFLKLDLQGHELRALAGASRSLRGFEVVLLETSVIPIGDVPIFSEVHAYMERAGYRLYDVVPQYYRPRDGALWQMDVLFVRNDSALIASNDWQ